MSRKSILIIKHGISWNARHGGCSRINYGDLLRATCLLEDLKGAHVTWITTSQASELFRGNHLIDELICADTPQDLRVDRAMVFDTVINLENQRDWRHFAGRIRARHRYGFNGKGGESFLELTQSDASEAPVPVQEMLFKLMGREWTGQQYVLGYSPSPEPEYDVGLNCFAMPNESTLSWPAKNWQRLEELLGAECRTSWPKQYKTIKAYIDWIASCRLIVTCDTLGLHLALALKKKVVALIDSAAPEQVYLYGNGVKVSPVATGDCLACAAGESKALCCLEDISPETVAEAMGMLLEAGQSWPVVVPLAASEPMPI